MKRQVYRRYEKGEREIPTWAVIQLARFYDVSTDYLLGKNACFQKNELLFLSLK